MSEHTPSKVQRRALEAMKDGSIAQFINGFWRINQCLYARSTIEAMEHAGWLRRLDRMSMLLTPLARAALKKAKE